MIYITAMIHMMTQYSVPAPNLLFFFRLNITELVLHLCYHQGVRYCSTLSILKIWFPFENTLTLFVDRDENLYESYFC